MNCKNHLQKLALLFLLTVCAALHLFADERSDFEQLLIANSGYYYCYENDQLLYLTYGNPADYDMNSTSGYSYLIDLTCTVNFETGTLSFGRGRGYQGIGSSSYDLKKTKKKFVIEGDRIISWNYMDRTYKALNMTADEAAAFVIRRACERFDYALGTWTDEKTGRSYTLSRGNSYTLTATYPASEQKATVTLPLQIDSPRLLYVSTPEGSYSLNFGTDGGFILYDSTEDPNTDSTIPRDYDDVSGCWVDFSFADYTPPAPAAPVPVKAPQRRTPLPGTYYFTYNGVLRYFTTGTDDLLIWEYSSETRRNECIDWITDFESYVDENGWYHVDAGTFSYIIIGNDNDSLAFCYTGDGVKSDAASMASFVPNPADLLEQYPGAKKILVSNVTASSTLREGAVIYAPEGVFTTLNSQRHLMLRDAKPWVEAVKGDGKGEKLECDFIAKPGRYDDGIILEILGGYVDPIRPHLFKQNGRPKTLEITTDTGYTTTVALPDEPKIVSVDLPLETRHLTITITDVYPGSKYSDTCITSIEARYWSGK